MFKEGYKLQLSILKAVKYPLSVEVLSFIVDMIGKYTPVEIDIKLLQNPIVLGAFTSVGLIIFIYDVLKHGLGVKLP